MPIAHPRWTLSRAATVAPDERPPAGQALALGFQHLFAMSGSTILGPLLMGFDPNLAILFSGVGTLVFFLLTGGRVPSYLGSSFSFIAVVLAVTGRTDANLTPDVGPALGGIMAAGALYALIGIVVIRTGSGWVERLMPPAVTGAVGAAIGLNLAPVAVRQIQGSGAHVLVAFVTIAATLGFSVYGPPLFRRVSILCGLGVGYACYLLAGNAAGLLPPIAFAPLADAAWIGMPQFRSPTFAAGPMLLIAPTALVLVAENLGHIRAIAAMTGQPLDRYIGRGFLGDGLATMISAAGGGTGVTTYVENMGVMAITRVYSTLIFVIAALAAIALGFSPKFGMLLRTIPVPVLGGLAVVVFGLIAAAMIRIWVDNAVDFADARNMLTVGTALVLGAGDFTLAVGGFAIGGIGTATAAAIALNWALGFTARDAATGSAPRDR